MKTSILYFNTKTSISLSFVTKTSIFLNFVYIVIVPFIFSVEDMRGKREKVIVCVISLFEVYTWALKLPYGKPFQGP